MLISTLNPNTVLGVYSIRDDWPVEERLNTVTSRLFEANIFEFVRKKQLRLIISKLKYNEKEKANQKFRDIALKDLAFAFAILGIGLEFSTVIVIIEVIVSRRRRTVRFRDDLPSL